MPSAKEKLAPQTAIGNSESFFVNNLHGAIIQVSPDLTGVEVAGVEISHDDGTTWVPYIDGTAAELSVTKNALKVYGPALHRVAKSVTAAETGIYVMDHQE